MNRCKNMCYRNKVPYKHSTYEHCKRCTKCSVWFMKDSVGLRCPCCSVILRVKKRSNVGDSTLRRIEA